MHRREVLRLLATGSILQLAPRNLLALASEARNLMQGQPSLRTLNTHQHAIVKAMAEMIIPRTESPGAAEVGVAEFIDLMLTEWYGEAERGRFLAGLADVDSHSRTLFGKDFLECASLPQSEILIDLGEQMLEQKAGPPLGDRDASEPPNFYAMFRQLTLTAYYTSEAGASDELHFEMIPGNYQGCPDAPIKQTPEHQ